MTLFSNEHLLTYAARRTQVHPGYLGWVLARYQEWENISERRLAELLECPDDNLPHLNFCLRPRADHFAEDVRQISAKFHLDAGKLASVIRLVESVETIASQGTQMVATEPGFLMAARARKKKRQRQDK